MLLKCLTERPDAGESGLKGEMDRTLRAAVQSALAKLDMVSRDEFDSQAEILARTRTRVEQLERELDSLVLENESQQNESQ